MKEDTDNKGSQRGGGVGGVLLAEKIGPFFLLSDVTHTSSVLQVGCCSLYGIFMKDYKNGWNFGIFL